MSSTTDSFGEWQVLVQQATMLLESGFLPKAIKTPAAAVAIILQGRELGIGPMTALNTINVISGKPTVSPQLMLALIQRTHELEGFSVTDDGEAAIVMMQRRGHAAHVERFGMAEAGRMQATEYVNNQPHRIPLAEKANWREQPETMRKWRAIAACARVVFPDAILGLYTPEEMGADVQVAEDGDMEIVTQPLRLAAPTEQPLPPLGATPERQPEPQPRQNPAPARSAPPRAATPPLERRDDDPEAIPFEPPSDAHVSRAPFTPDEIRRFEAAMDEAEEYGIATGTYVLDLTRTRALGQLVMGNLARELNARKATAKPQERPALLEHYAALCKTADGMGIDLTPYEVDVTVNNRALAHEIRVLRSVVQAQEAQQEALPV